MLNKILSILAGPQPIQGEVQKPRAILELEGRTHLLQAENLRLKKLIAARDAWEGCDVQSPQGKGLVVEIATTVAILLDSGHVLHAQSVEDLRRLTAPDPRKALEAREMIEELRSSADLAETELDGELELLFCPTDAQDMRVN